MGFHPTRPVSPEPGLKVRVVFWRHGTSRELREAADELLELDPYFDQLTRLPGTKAPRSPLAGVINQRGTVASEVR